MLKGKKIIVIILKKGLLNKLYKRIAEFKED